MEGDFGQRARLLPSSLEEAVDEAAWESLLRSLSLSGAAGAAAPLLERWRGGRRAAGSSVLPAGLMRNILAPSPFSSSLPTLLRPADESGMLPVWRRRPLFDCGTLIEGDVGEMSTGRDDGRLGPVGEEKENDPDAANGGGRRDAGDNGNVGEDGAEVGSARGDRGGSVADDADDADVDGDTGAEIRRLMAGCGVDGDDEPSDDAVDDGDSDSEPSAAFTAFTSSDAANRARASMVFVWSAPRVSEERAGMGRGCSSCGRSAQRHQQPPDNDRGRASHRRHEAVEDVEGGHNRCDGKRRGCTPSLNHCLRLAERWTAMLGADVVFSGTPPLVSGREPVCAQHATHCSAARMPVILMLRCDE